MLGRPSEGTMVSLLEVIPALPECAFQREDSINKGIWGWYGAGKPRPYIP